MEKYILDSEDNRKFLEDNARALLNFGRRFPSPGGGSYYLGDDGSPWTDRPRETWITSRMAHVYSIGTMMGVEGCRELAEDAVKGLNGELKDRVNGGWYAGLTKDNEPLPDKQCYAAGLADNTSVSSEQQVDDWYRGIGTKRGSA